MNIPSGIPERDGVRSVTGYAPRHKGLKGCRKDKGCVSATRDKHYGRDEYPVRPEATELGGVWGGTRYVPPERVGVACGRCGFLIGNTKA